MCKAWNAKCKLAGAKNAMAGIGTGNQNWGWPESQQWPRVAPECQPTQRSAVENGQDQIVMTM